MCSVIALSNTFAAGEVRISWLYLTVADFDRSVALFCVLSLDALSRLVPDGFIAVDFVPLANVLIEIKVVL